MSKKRYVSLLLTAFISLTFVSVRFFYFSVLQNKTLKTLASSQQTVCSDIRNIRGIICDRNMIKMTDKCTGVLYLDENGRITHTETPFPFTDTFRYSSDRTACHIIGHTDSESNGVCGIEKAFDSYLKTEDVSYVKYFSDAVGSPVGDIKKHTTVNKGATVRLTIDSHIQKSAEKIMKKYNKTGAVVILDTQTSDILACVSLPDYNASDVAAYLNSEKGELINRAFMSYDAGSVFKIVTSAAAIEKNPQYPQRDFWCAGEFVPGEEAVFECHLKEGHGALKMDEAFAKSCNCAFFETGLCTGAEDICNTARAFGFGSEVLTLRMDEQAGNIPCKNTYTDYETLNLSIGQGDILITPLQCTLMCATIANRGIRNSVNLVESVTMYGGATNDSFYTQNPQQVISSATAKAIGEMMREAVLSGTASEAAESSVCIAGKTGSAQTGWENDDGSLKVHGWFCGFFPYDSPRYAMTVFAEDGKSGSESCIRPFVEIAEAVMEMFPEANCQSKIRFGLK